MTLENIAKEIKTSGLCVCPDFLSPEELQSVRLDLKKIELSGDFRRAGVGHRSGLAVRDQVRSDQIHWLEKQEANPVQLKLLHHFEELQITLNRSLYLGLTGFEGHYAAYPAGGFYQRHLDAFAHDNSRLISVILYLNSDWQTQDGGQLRIYTQNSHIDINPVGGTLVCFLSREFEHEVLISSAPRLSFTGWFTSDSPEASRRRY